MLVIVYNHVHSHGSRILLTVLYLSAYGSHTIQSLMRATTEFSNRTHTSTFLANVNGTIQDN